MGWGEAHRPAAPPGERRMTSDEAASIDARFQAFHAANPHVYERLVAMALQLRRRGHQRLGIGMLWEVLRWRQMLETDDPASGFKLNDHFRSRYARLIMEQEAELAGAFELRPLRAA